MNSETEAFQVASERLSEFLDAHPAPPGMRYDFQDTVEIHHNEPSGLVRATVQAKLVPIEEEPKPELPAPEPEPEPVAEPKPEPEKPANNEA